MLSNLNFIVTIGIIVAIMSLLVKVVGVPDQIKKNHKRKSTEGLSLTYYVMSFSTYFLWAVYGELKEDWPVFFAQGFLGCVATGIILWQFFLYRKKRDKDSQNNLP